MTFSSLFYTVVEHFFTLVIVPLRQPPRRATVCYRAPLQLLYGLVIARCSICLVHSATDRREYFVALPPPIPLEKHDMEPAPREPAWAEHEVCAAIAYCCHPIAHS